MNQDNNHYTFTVEGIETPEKSVDLASHSQELEHTFIEAQKSYMKKSLRRVVAICVAVALLFGGGVGILLNEYVFNAQDGTGDVLTGDALDPQGEPDPANPNPNGTQLPNVGDNAGNLLYTESNNKKALSTADVVEAVEGSIVAITVEIENSGVYYNQDFNYTSEAKGSGVIISSDGYIVTNNHVISGAARVYVTLANGETYDAEIIGRDEFTDLGLIKINTTGLTAAQFGDSDSIRKGDQAIILGNPLGYLDGSVSSGIISATGRRLHFSDGSILYNLIQTDAAVNPGNSGGGLFDAYGALIGIVCAKTSAADVEGLGFGIPTSTVRTVIQDLKDHGYVTGRPALGINAMVVSDPYTAMMNKLPRLGVYVSGFINKDAEENSELEIGDCIVGINGTEVTSSEEILALLYPYSVGDVVEITVYRGSEQITIQSTLVEQDENY